MGKNPGNSAMPSSGATEAAGKSNEPDAVLRTGKLPASEAVRQAKFESGITVKCVDNQVGQDGNGKKRDAAVWGTGAKAAADAKELK